MAGKNDKKSKGNAQHPPAAGSHKPKDTTNHGGGYGAGPQGPGVHESLRKPGLMK